MIEVTSPDSARLMGLLERLEREHGIALLRGAAGDEFAAGEGDSLTLLIDDPLRAPEVWDVAVVLPEALAALPAPPRVAVADMATSRALGERFDVRRYPAMLFRRAGDYVGVVHGMLDWDAFVPAIVGMLAAPVKRAPGIGIPVRPAGAGGCSSGA